MNTIKLRFGGIDQDISVTIYPDANSQFFWQNLLTYNKPADSIGIPLPPAATVCKFIDIAKEADELFQLNWDLTSLTQDNFNTWHRFIETFDLSKFPPWSQEKGDLFIQLHHALHAAEIAIAQNNNTTFVRKFIHFKWFGDSVAWPVVPTFQMQALKGEIIADYPHVGKSPWVCQVNNENNNLQQFCKLPDACAPAGQIMLVGNNEADLASDAEIKQQRYTQLGKWYDDHIIQLATMFSKEKMLAHYGVQVVGRLTDLSQLDLLRNATITSAELVTV